MSLVAYSRIVHGKDDGSRLVIEEGNKVSGLDKETMQALKEAGVVGEEAAATPDEVEELRAKVAELEAQLAGARNPASQEEADKAAKAATQPVKQPKE